MDQIKEPPKGWMQSIKYFGPGLVVSASIVGSGELIATTVLGAKAGFWCLWLIILSCFIKVPIQAMLGRYTISTGKVTLQAFNEIPGPHFRASWIIWLWIFMMVTKFIQFGGIAGGVAQVLHIAIPNIGVAIWVIIVIISVIALLIRSYYRFIENFATITVAIFTFITVACVLILRFTPFSISMTDIAQGFMCRIPIGAAAVAFAAFGITGIGGDELIAYPYWCFEKGYYRFVGENNPSEEWIRRAKGWISVMHKDVVISMIIYTIATIAFYLLGASILHRMGEIPAGYNMISVLSHMYTETLGPWASVLFLIGAFIVLYSTLFSWTAASARISTDCLSTLRIFNIKDTRRKNKWILFFSVLFPISYAITYLFMRSPVQMVILGGIGTGIMLVVITFATIYLAYRKTDRRLVPSKRFGLLLWISGLIIAFVGIYAIYQQLFKG